MKKLLQKEGFTLIELLVVIAIIGVLTSVLLANMVGIRERGNDTKLKNDLRQLKTALRLYYNDNQTYPDDGEGGSSTINCEQLDGVDEGDFIATNGAVYMRDIPTSEDGCEYQQRNGGEGFLLKVDLTNTGDPDIAESVDRCSPSDPEDGEYFECAD